MRNFHVYAGRIVAAVVVLLAAFSTVAVGLSGASGPPTVDLKVLLIGTGSSDPTTAAWEATLSNEGVPYTEDTATGAYFSETVTLPALTTSASSGTVGNYDGVVLADAPAAFAAGQLSALDTYESTYGVRQVDGYGFPSPSLGITDVSSGPLDGTTAQLTAAGLAALPNLKGPIPFALALPLNRPRLGIPRP